MTLWGEVSSRKNVALADSGNVMQVKGPKAREPIKPVRQAADVSAGEESAASSLGTTDDCAALLKHWIEQVLRTSSMTLWPLSPAWMSSAKCQMC